MGAAISIAALPALAAPASFKSFKSFDRFVVDEMAKDNVPGLAVAIVKDGQVVHLRGYGYRDMEAKLPVTPNTVFGIASVTKSFTVLAMGALVEQGELDWDQPVRRYLPEFQLQDAFASERITSRDLVTHRSGLPRHDLVWYRTDSSRHDLVQSLRYLQPSAELRTRYQYNNLMYAAAGEVAAHASGVSWDELIEREVFRPVGMQNSFTNSAGFERAAERALPYRRNPSGAAELGGYVNIDAIGPAGGVDSTIADMSLYLRALMGGGKLEGRQVLSARTIADMQTPQTIMPPESVQPEVGPMQYGMGLMLSSYRGQRQVRHGGSIDGFISLMAWLPDAQVGVVVLTNQGKAILRDVIGYRVFDELLGLQPIDWSGRFAAKRAADRAKRTPPTAGKPGTHPSHDLADYAGEYEHPAYGVVRIERHDNGLTLAFHGMDSALEHFHYDVFSTPAGKYRELEELKVAFASDVDGNLGSLAVDLDSYVDPIVFKRRTGMR